MKKTSRLLPKSNEPQNTETNKVDRNAPITSKDVFPKRSANMIDRTEKPKIPLKFAKCAAWYNEFGYKKQIQFNSFGLQFGDWMLKRIGKSIRENAFKQKKKNPQLKFNPRIALISLRTTKPSCLKRRDQESLKNSCCAGMVEVMVRILSKLKFYQAFFLQLCKLHLW